MGIFVAVPIFLSGDKDWWPNFSGFEFLGPLAFVAVIYWIYKSVTKK